MLKLKLTLLVLMMLFAGSAYAQDDCDAVIVECEVLLEEMATQRDQAINDTDAVETERDVEAGKRQTFERLYHQERQKPPERKGLSGAAWFGMGAGSGATAIGVVLLLVVLL